MGLRFRKSIKLGPGVRLNLGRKSASISVGGPLGRYTIGTTGRRTKSVNLPGGFSYVSTSSGSGNRTTSPRPTPLPQRAPAPAATGVDSLPKPGLFAPGAEKRYHEGIRAYIAGDMTKALEAFKAASSKDTRNVSDDLFAGLAAASLDRRDEAISFLERVVGGDVELPDTLQRKYLPPERVQLSITVAITDRVKAVIGIDSLGAALVLAELYQETGRREDAIGLFQQLAAENADPALRLSLCDLLFDAQDYEGVVETAIGAENDSDVGLATLHLKAMALAMLGMRAPAIDSFAACLRRTSGRDAELLTEIRYDRATYFDTIGEAAKAKADWERLYASAPNFRDVATKVGRR